MLFFYEETMKLRIFTILMFLTIITGAGYVLKSFHRAEEKRVYTSKKINLKLQTFALATALDYLFSDYIKDITILATRVAYQDPLVVKMERDFELLINSGHFLINIGFLNTKGILKYIYPSKYSNCIGIDYSFRDYFKDAEKTNNLIISLPLENHQHQNKVFEYSSIVIINPVYDRNNKNAGYLTFEVDIDEIGQLIQLDRVIEENSHISYYLVDVAQKEILCYPSLTNQPYFHLKNKKFRDFLINFSSDLKGSTAMVDFEGNNLYISSNYINYKDSSVMIIAVQPYSKSINYSANYARRFLLIIIFILLILVLITILVICNKVIVKKLQGEITKLKIDIDIKATQKETKHITENDFFKNLSKNAAVFKKNLKNEFRK